MTGIGQEIWSVEADEPTNGPVVSLALVQTIPTSPGAMVFPCLQYSRLLRRCPVGSREQKRRVLTTGGPLVEIGEKDQVIGSDGLDNAPVSLSKWGK